MATLTQLRKQYQTNAEMLRGMAERATRSGQPVNGFTAAQLADHAHTYQLLALSNDADLRQHLAASSAAIAASAAAYGKQGGLARAKKLSAKRRSAIAKKAGKAGGWPKGKKRGPRQPKEAK